jgi:serine protease Do
MKKPMGALVSRVLPDSPAERGGIKVGDVIVGFAGHDVVSSAKLPPIVGSTPIGKQVDVDVIREGTPRTLRVTLDELPEEEALQAATTSRTEASSSRLGLTVTDLSSVQRKQLELDEGGVMVESVEDGAGRHAGIVKGDVVVMFNNVRVKDAEQFTTLVDDAPAGEMVPVLVQRRGGPIFLAVKVPG